MWDSFRKTIIKASDFLSEVGGWLLAFMAFLIFVDVGARYFFDSPLPSVYEFSEEILMVSFVFLAISGAHHIDVTLLVAKYRGRFKRNMASARYLLSFIFLGLVTWQSVNMTIISWQQDEISTSLLTYPLYPARATLIIGFGLLALAELVKFIDTAVLGREE